MYRRQQQQQQKQQKQHKKNNDIELSSNVPMYLTEKKQDNEVIVVSRGDLFDDVLSDDNVLLLHGDDEPNNYNDNNDAVAIPDWIKDMSKNKSIAQQQEQQRQRDKQDEEEYDEIELSNTVRSYLSQQKQYLSNRSLLSFDGVFNDELDAEKTVSDYDLNDNRHQVWSNHHVDFITNNKMMKCCCTFPRCSAMGWFQVFLFVVVIPEIILLLLTSNSNNDNDNNNNNNNNEPSLLLSFQEQLQQSTQFVIDHGWSNADDFQDNESIQSMALLQIMSTTTNHNDNNNNDIISIDMQLYVLTVLYFTLSNNNGQNISTLLDIPLNNDDNTYNACGWEYVTCHDNGNIESLTIPPSTTNNTTFLANTTTTLPQELYLLSNLKHLSIPQHNIVEIMEPLEQTTSTTIIFPNLIYLDLSQNYLNTTIPNWIYHLEHLETLYLAECHLTGSLSSEIGNLKELHRLNLTSTALTGTLPTEIGSLTKLEILELSSNYLKGSIPNEIDNLSALKNLYIAFQV